MNPTKDDKKMAAKAFAHSSESGASEIDGTGLMEKFRQRVLARVCHNAIRLPSEKEAEAAVELGAKVAKKACSKS